MNLLAILAVALLFVGLFVMARSAGLFARAVKQRSDMGLPRGKLAYIDEGLKSEVLSSETWGLKGKPDLLVKQGEMVVPVDQKPGRSRPRPYRSQVMQLAAYCALVEERYGVRPSHGLIRYAGDGVDIEVPYTEELEAELRATLERMRKALASENVHRSHNSANKCRACGFRGVCEESLAA